VPAGGPPAAAQDPVQSTELSAQEINDRFVQQIAERIVGREKEPAGRVFKNMRIAWLKTTPARQLLDIMNGGYARALGVRCTHCHVEGDFPRRQLGRRPALNRQAPGRKRDRRRGAL